jgi:hypothetical protein
MPSVIAAKLVVEPDPQGETITASHARLLDWWEQSNRQVLGLVAEINKYFFMAFERANLRGGLQREEE